MEYTVTHQPMPQGTVLLRFHEGEGKKFGDRYIGVCCVIPLSDKLAEVQGMTTHDGSNVDVSLLVARIDKKLKEMGFKYRFYESVLEDKDGNRRVVGRIKTL